jgi:hypothetical protein
LVSFTPRPLYSQGKRTWYQFDRRLGGSQGRSGRGGEEKNSQSPPGLEPSIIQPIVQRYTTELPPCTQHFTLKMEAACTSELLVSYHNPEDLDSNFYSSETVTIISGYIMYKRLIYYLIPG